MNGTTELLGTASFPLTGNFLAGRLRHNLSLDDLQYIEGLVESVDEHEDGARLLSRGIKTDRSTILIEGYIFRTIESGNKRFITGVHVPGDFVDLHGFPMKRLDHNVASLDTVTLAKVPHTAIARLVERFPHLARAMWFSTLLDAAMHREWIFRLGRLNAEGRIAHLVSEIIERLKFVGRFDGTNLPVPLLQRDYAEACGITSVHANRSFRNLRERGILDPQGDGRIVIQDEAALNKLGEFDGDYLYGDGDLALDTLDDR